MCATAEEVLADSELIVIGNRDERFADVLQNLPKDQVVIDLVRISNEMVTSLDHQYRGICW
jgi:GDP-mannose 6-dehydrogenase